MKQKIYWLRGLIGGVIAYVLFLFILYICLSRLGGGDGEYAFGLILPIIAPFLLPVIPLGAFIGWFYGRKIN
ncbi:MAG: hypothetical protein WCT29_00350 [Candidatus Paceibacterota bacterium]|jgi:hypothetical protein